ncbi:MAG TPA: hypothetical protein VMJ10_05920 [Kofleriaceae bacterium]|nr:hypothetical protein [Kofleriaceae bacterium]
MNRYVLALLVLASSVALADGEIRLDVELGKQVEVDVGYVRGWMCDDPSLVTAEIVTREDRNVWIVTGAKLGHTLCRVGTDPTMPRHYVFDLHVVEPKPRK